MPAIRRVLCSLLPLLPMALGAAACTKNEQAVPPGPPPLPPLPAAETLIPKSPAAPASADPASTSKEASALPAAAAPAAGAAPVAPLAAHASAADGIRGNLNLADNLKSKAKDGTTLFLVARMALDGGAVGPVLAVQRYTIGSWPLAFELTQNNVMITGMPFSGRAVLTARIDQDGDAMTKEIGDIEGVSQPITIPAQGVSVLLDKVRTEAAGAPSPPGMGQAGGNTDSVHGHASMPAGHP